jgi:hypothetical protein
MSEFEAIKQTDQSPQPVLQMSVYFTCCGGREMGDGTKAAKQQLSG